MSARAGIAPESPDPCRYDLTTAAGYNAWRRDGGRWSNETHGRLVTYAEAELLTMDPEEEAA